MTVSRRRFLTQSAALLTIVPIIKPMRHIVLLGDSIFDNGSYTRGGPDVITQVRHHLPAGWKATLLAIDGATTEGIRSQMARLPLDTTDLVLSVGGNNALMRQDILDKPVRSSGEALLMLAKAVQEFESAYKKAVSVCMKPGLPLTVCTIYNGNFSDPDFQRRATIAIATFNDAILRISIEQRLRVLELRQICEKPEDYANPIEPSSIGGEKIAKAIVRTVMEPAPHKHGAYVIGS